MIKVEHSEEVIELRRGTIELKVALDHEKKHRINLEEHIALLQREHQKYSNKDEEQSQ